MPARSNGICCAALASRPHKARVVWSAHCRSSITRMVGRTAHCSVTSASTCSASTPGSAGISPRSCRMIIFRRGFTEGSRTRSPSRGRLQRQCLGKLVSGAPEHLAASLRRPSQSRSHQRGLADAWLALDEYRAAAAAGHLSYQPGQQRHLPIAADQRVGFGHRVHVPNVTSRSQLRHPSINGCLARQLAEAL